MIVLKKVKRSPIVFGTIMVNAWGFYVVVVVVFFFKLK